MRGGGGGGGGIQKGSCALCMNERLGCSASWPVGLQEVQALLHGHLT